MVDEGIVTSKLRELAEKMDRVRQYCPPELSLLTEDLAALDLVSFNLMLAVQSCLDIASHLISDEGWPPAGTLAGGFRRLQEKGVLSAETTEALSRAAGLRNVIAHGYADADPEQIYQAATVGLSDLERFAAEVSVWMAKRLGL
jgi:uncharacterized protein YutE (UPF0331/DUF86 family)